MEAALYNFVIPDWLGEYYALDPVTAAEAGFTELNGVPLAETDFAYPCMHVLPMGCSCAAYWCQDVHSDPPEDFIDVPKELCENIHGRS